MLRVESGVFKPPGKTKTDFKNQQFEKSGANLQCSTKGKIEGLRNLESTYSNVMIPNRNILYQHRSTKSFTIRKISLEKSV